MSRPVNCKIIELQIARGTKNVTATHQNQYLKERNEGLHSEARREIRNSTIVVGWVFSQKDWPFFGKGKEGGHGCSKHGHHENHDLPEKNIEIIGESKQRINSLHYISYPEYLRTMAPKWLLNCWMFHNASKNNVRRSKKRNKWLWYPCQTHCWNHFTIFIRLANLKKNTSNQ